MFNPNSPDSCSYYGYKYPYNGDKLSLMPSPNRRTPYPVEYYPQQSRDYALSNTIECECTLCPVNKNNFCSIPALIKITAGGKCRTGIAFVEQATGTRLEGTEPERRNEFTPIWFFNKWDTNCPQLGQAEIESYDKKVFTASDNNRETAWNYDVIDVNTGKRI